MGHTAYTPPEYRTVTPYLIVARAAELIGFISSVFGGEEIQRNLRPDGSVQHAALRLGDTLIELAEARDAWPPMPAALHIYVPDTDAAYRRALTAGATTLYEPADMDYGERSAGVQDPHGNHWYIATALTPGS
ncbi:MAG TPA: VOC family protein [Roseiflexaceae bacterium]|nr:VOC family protein [Roseiflexaceae bacterium]